MERLFRTLQERLVVELRLAGATSLEPANAVLSSYRPRFNAQFAVPAADVQTAWRPLPTGYQAEEVLCFKYRRTVAADNTISFAGQRLQLAPGPQRRSYARAHVEVQERLDGSLAVYHAGGCVATTSAPLEAPVLRVRGRPLRQAAGNGAEVAPVIGPATPEAAPTEPKPLSRPRPDHPWKQPIVARQRTKSRNT